MTDRMETRLPIPSPVTPLDTVCLQIDVPNSTDHISALWGQIYQLTLWNAWDRDTAHSGKTLAAEWVKALNSLRTCTGEKVRPGIEIEDFMPLRVDCDCNVFVTCCDGTEKQLLTGDQVKALLQTQPGSGTPQPQPGGGCQSYDYTIQGTQQWLVPVALSTGDTVEITDSIGASNIVGTIDWNCPDGFIFFAGSCVGSANHDPSNRVPAAPTGSVILFLNGVYYDLTTPFTVPGGVSLLQGTLLLNYPSGSGVNGSVQGGVKVCNHTVAAWSHTFDLRASPFGWTVGGPAGAWVPGAGFEAGNPTGGNIALRSRFTAAADFTVTSWKLTYDVVNSTAGGGGDIVLRNAGLGVLQETIDGLGSGTSYTARVLSLTATQAGVRVIDIDGDALAAGGSLTAYKFEISGTGTDPF